MTSASTASTSRPSKVNDVICAQVTAAVVTCGGLCPGLNDVIQNIVFTLEDYGVPPDQIFGIRYGLRGFYDREFKPINLNKRVVQNIHLQGGTMLVSSACPSRCWQCAQSKTGHVMYIWLAEGYVVEGAS